jgi:hypothetical protein
MGIVSPSADGMRAVGRTQSAHAGVRKYARPLLGVGRCAEILTAAAMLGAPSRVPPPSLLLGSDGLPMKKSGGAQPPAGAQTPEGVPPPVAVPTDDFSDRPAVAVSKPDSMPSDLADFDPTFDPLAAPRPLYDLAAASGRPDEALFGAAAPASSEELGEWAEHMRGAGVSRVLGLFSAEEAAARAANGTPEGYFSELVSAGFEASGVGLLDPHAPGAREAVLGMAREAQQSKERLCVHCADGTKHTSVVLADWLMTDYIGGSNTEEAIAALAARKRLAGVERVADAEALERWVEQGHL